MIRLKEKLFVDRNSIIMKSSYFYLSNLFLSSIPDSKDKFQNKSDSTLTSNLKSEIDSISDSPHLNDDSPLVLPKVDRTISRVERLIRNERRRHEARKKNKKV
jgi:hypothetical protein